jgi:NTE family protein
MPGLITPAARKGRWLVDGGLVNPVPISLCRAMGADFVVAVDLNTVLLRRQFSPQPDSREASEENRRDEPSPVAADTESDVVAEASRLLAAFEDWARELRNRIGGINSQSAEGPPSLYEVMANSLNIMQVRITRSRMAGDPADLLVTPRLADFALLDLDRGAEAIEEGTRATEQALAVASYDDLGTDRF